MRKELGWKAAQENRLAWQEKLSNQQHERNRAVETKLVEQMRKNTSDLATNSLLEARMRAPTRTASAPYLEYGVQGTRPRQCHACPSGNMAA